MDFVKAVGHAIQDIAEMIDSRNKINVTLDRYSYVGGDIVQGTVSLSCIVPFTARGVVVKIKGFERASWEEWRQQQTQEGQPPERYIYVHKDSKEFFCDHIRVYPHEGIVQSGEYSFPFQYQLPPTLPGTYYESGGTWKYGDGYSAEIIYFAKAKIDVAFKHDLKRKLQFVVNEKFDQYVQPSYGENNKTFLLTKGRLTAKVWLDKNVYFPGNTVIARLEANNTSVKPTNKVNVMVIKHLELNAHGQHWQKRMEVYKQHYNGFEPSYFGVRWLPFPIPINLLPSTNSSKMVRCHYYFVVECDIPGAIDLRVELPTSILAPQWLFSSHPQMPPPISLPPDVSFRPPWQPDSTAPKCTKCSNEFSLFNRRHHCRHCGLIFCGKCAVKSCKIANLGYVEEPVRVCDGCWPNASTGGHQFQVAPVLPNEPPQELPMPPMQPMQPMPSAPFVPGPQV